MSVAIIVFCFCYFFLNRDDRFVLYKLFGELKCDFGVGAESLRNLAASVVVDRLQWLGTTSR